MDEHIIKTYLGKEFCFSDVDHEAIDIRDIAHSLSHLCRFTGHTNLFYSVAQHCLLVAEKIPGGPEEKLAALLHDAAEAYVGDLSSPLKKWLCVMGGGRESDYNFLHDEILACVFRKYDLLRGDLPHAVEVYDKAACQFEQQAFMWLPENSDGMLWEPWEPGKFAGEAGDRDMGQVETEFLERFAALMAACGRRHLV